jgi:EAL domain-containing protein (putative c-di-GMP-specific phosphodiesterase class I)
VTDRVAQEALDRALDGTDQLLLYYQPIHDVRTGAIYGAEALLRQRRESGEIRGASIITETAEDSGGAELFALDSIVMRKAYATARQWPPGLRMHVNLSPREFEEGNLVERLLQFDHPQRLVLEITETSYIEHPKQTVDVLRAIKDMGIALWLDDFGTGHSSLTHLQHFPLDGIKLAGVFVKRLLYDRRCRAIVRALLELAHELELKVIAEEVERQEQLDFLLEHRCELVQGFLFSRPMTAQALQDLLQTGRES